MTNVVTAERCSICKHPERADFVSRRHLEGKSFLEIERMTRAHPTLPVMKAETMSLHLRHHKSSPTVIAVEHARAQQSQEDDVAVLVQRDIVAKLKAGEARVTVQHGLQAQQLLDRRAERAKDRELAVTLARLLHTPPPPPDLIEARPALIEEGSYVRVSDDG